MQERDPASLAASVLAAVPDPVSVVDGEGRIVWWNDRLEAVTGYDAAWLDGADAVDLVAPEHREEALAAFERAGTFSPTETLEFDLLTRDGERVPHEFNGTVLEHAGHGLDTGAGENRSTGVGEGSGLGAGEGSGLGAGEGRGPGEADDRGTGAGEGRTLIAVVARDVSARREREEAIRRQRDELDTLDRIDGTVHGVVQSVVDAATRQEIEEVACERLAASELYRAVWIARTDAGDVVEPHTGIGVGEGFLEAVAEVNELPWTRPAQRAADTGELQVLQRIAEADVPEPVAAAAARFDIESGASIPVVHRDAVLGVLTVYSSRPDAFTEREQEAFRRLGEVVGFAIRAVQTERLVLSDTATELTFRVTGGDAFLAPLSAMADGPCHHEWATPAGDGRYRHYVSVRGLDPAEVVALGERRPTVERVAHVGADGDADRYEVVSTDSLVKRFLEVGAAPVSTVAEDGVTTVVVELPGDADVRPVVEAAESLYDAQLVSKREVERPVRTAEGFRNAVSRRLTDRQGEALRHALFGGYYDWPRGSTAEEVAEAMGISSATLHYHLRRAERARVAVYLENLETSRF